MYSGHNRKSSFRQSGSSGIDTVFLIITTLILMGIVAYFYQTMVVMSREVALRTELNNMRMAIGIYRMMAGHHPESLLSVSGKSTGPINEDKTGTIFTDYFRPGTVDSEGYPLDPFGNRYSYVDGRVFSVTKSYDMW